MSLKRFKGEIDSKKKKITKQFQVYYARLKETESILLRDLDVVLDMVTREKEKESKDLNEVITTKEFMYQQLTTSTNKKLKKHVDTFETDIEQMQDDLDCIPYLGLEWRHRDLCQKISEACHISFLNDTTVSYSKKQDILQSDVSCSDWIECYDCCFDKFDQQIYLLGKILKGKVAELKIHEFDKSMKPLPYFSIDVSHKDINPPCYITTSENYIFITAGKKPGVIVRISKRKKYEYSYYNATPQQIKKVLDDTPDKSVVLGDFLFSTCVNAELLYKFRITDLEKEMNVSLTGNSEGVCVNFLNAKEIRSDDTLLYILFNSDSFKSICSFNDEGILIKVMVTNSRRLQKPFSFCLDKENNIIVADKNTIKVFDHYGRPIHTIECAMLWSRKSILYNCVDNQIIVLADFNGKYLHVF